MKISSPFFEERNFFPSQSIVTLEDLPQLAGRDQARNCASVLFTFSFQGAVSQTPFSNYEFA